MTATTHVVEHPEWEEGLAQWQRLFQLERIPQAIILSQEQGTSHCDFGMLCAQSLLCPKPQQGVGCGVCQSCRWFQAAAHPDFYLLGDDGTGTNIESIRSLLSALQQTAHQSGRQVVLLKGCDAYSAAVGNALLKTLEEPIGDVVFLLLAQRESRVMQTIRSRCFKIHLSAAQMAESEMHQMAKNLFSEPQNQSFLPKELQNWVVEQPQEALIVLYNVIKERLQHALIQDPVNAMPRSVKADVLKNTIAFMGELGEAQKHCQLPGINKLLLIESLFYQWQKLHNAWDCPMTGA